MVCQLLADTCANMAIVFPFFQAAIYKSSDLIPRKLTVSGCVCTQPQDKRPGRACGLGDRGPESLELIKSASPEPPATSRWATRKHRKPSTWQDAHVLVRLNRGSEAGLIHSFPSWAACPGLRSSTPFDTEPIPPDIRRGLSDAEYCDIGKPFVSLCPGLPDWFAPSLISELPAPAQG